MQRSLKSASPRGAISRRRYDPFSSCVTGWGRKLARLQRLPSFLTEADMANCARPPFCALALKHIPPCLHLDSRIVAVDARGQVGAKQGAGVLVRLGATRVGRLRQGSALRHTGRIWCHHQLGRSSTSQTRFVPTPSTSRRTEPPSNKLPLLRFPGHGSGTGRPRQVSTCRTPRSHKVTPKLQIPLCRVVMACFLHFDSSSRAQSAALHDKLTGGYYPPCFPCTPCTPHEHSAAARWRQDW